MVKSMTFIAMVTEYLVTSKRKQGYCNNNENSLPSVVHVKVTQITLIAERQDVWNLAQVQGDRLFLPYPRLLPRFYGEMVEHLKVPHSSFENLSPDASPQLPRWPWKKSVSSKSYSCCSKLAAEGGKIKIADGEEAKKMLDLNMNTKSADNEGYPPSTFF